MTSLEGRKLHSLAEQAREQGNFLKALELTDQAIIAYQKDNDSLGFAEVQASRFLTFRHLHEQTEDEKFLILAKYAAEASVELAEKSGDSKALALPYFNLAKAQENLGEIPSAVGNYQKAVQNMIANPPEEHGQRPAIIADMIIHQSTAEYKNGDKEALEKTLAALVDLEGSSEPKYNKDVWLSGAHMRIAEMLKDDDLTKAKEHLQKAKEIIDSNSDLKLRKTQWEKLAAFLKK